MDLSSYHFPLRSTFKSMPFFVGQPKVLWKSTPKKMSTKQRAIYRMTFKYTYRHTYTRIQHTHEYTLCVYCFFFSPVAIKSNRALNVCRFDESFSFRFVPDFIVSFFYSKPLIIVFCFELSAKSFAQRNFLLCY